MNRHFFNGRYGWDKLSTVFTVFGLLSIFARRYGFILGVILIGASIYRAFSRNIAIRSREEAQFEDIIGRIGSFFKNLFTNSGARIRNFKEERKYVITTCPNCSQRLRLPKGKGNIIVTCKRCSYEFKLRT